MGNRLEFGPNEIREVDGRSVTEHSISATVVHVGFPSRSDDLTLDLIAPATKQDEENRKIALESTEETAREVTAKFKIWKAGIGEAAQVLLLDRLRKIVVGRLESQLDVLCAESVHELADDHESESSITRETVTEDESMRNRPRRRGG